MSSKSVFIIVGGANGSGKSTFTESYLKNKNDMLIIDPDKIARELPNNISNKDIAAGKISINKMNEYIKENKNFIVETTLSGNTHLKMLDKAIEEGYKTTLIYVGTENYNKNINRINQRALQGLHDIPKNDVIRRYKRSLENLKNYYNKVDEKMIFDNTKSYKKLLHVDKQKVKYLAPKTPKWLKQALGSELKVLRAKDQEQKKENER
ncbi:zeta toxin family protein [Sulfurospirillum arcachonense]|uniref:zeta toxin family protein n=1 Tax=Sulfurospirillum arcachonense TaxID=57666 RepID=UPI000469931E|nr:zeta toxin family protein [Sulfurospirillum arcachonense]